MAFHSMTAALVLAAGLGLAGAAQAAATDVDIIGGTGDTIGRASLTPAPTGILIRIEISPGGLTPGWHGMHLHSVGDCSDVGTFKKSKGHINFDDNAHGLLNDEGPDNADLPNIHADETGAANAEVFTHLVKMDGERGLLDADGSALVIHANEDDHLSQPIGGAGARLACGVIGG
ncbi:superoxide dismutase family protein [Pyruvatibacter mobilis]|jgi:Cu-Zn family superoxide dismutase|uniref:superoxide dismutase family protein n=1 Tax=Pyruvatibacter mobilis TaxID=1712261 RepID=UPI003BAB682F